MKFKRIFLLIIDSLGVGETLDAVNFGDSGANTLGHVLEKEDFIDGLHPNTQGHRKIFNYIVRNIER